MVYQTPLRELGEWFGPALVHSYACDAVARFGARAGIDLGIVGDDGVGVEPGQSLRGPRHAARTSPRHSPPACRCRARACTGSPECSPAAERGARSPAVVPRAPRRVAWCVGSATASGPALAVA